MKYLLSIGLLLVFQVSAFSQSYGSLIFFTDRGEAFTLYVNGAKINETPAGRVIAERLATDFCKTRVVFEDKNLGELNKSVMLSYGKALTLTIKRNRRGSFVLRMVGEAPLESKRQPGQVNTETVDVKAGSSSVPPSTTVTGESESISTNDAASVQIQAAGQSLGINVNVSTEMSSSSSFSSSSNSTETTSQTKESVAEDGCSNPMPAIDFGSAKQSIASKSFSDSKMAVAKRVAQSNCLNSEQVKEVMLLFNFEEDRLSFAKYAYDFVIDKKAYYKVYDAFTYEMSIEELDSYIQMR